MKKGIIILLLLQVTLCYYQLAAQNAQIEWQRRLGGAGAETGYSFVHTPDGGYLVLSSTETHSNVGQVTGNHGISGSTDIWLARLDSNHNFMWGKCIGGTYWDEATSIVNTSDGNYMIAGTVASHNSGDISGGYASYDIWAAKIDSAGNILWEKSFGGNGQDRLKKLLPTPDGGYMLAGYVDDSSYDVSAIYGSFDYWLAKIDSAGNIEWEKNYGGTDDDRAEDVILTNDGGYIVVGGSASTDQDITAYYDTMDVWVVKIDVQGNIQWQKNYGGSGYDYGNYIRQTFDHGYVVGGRTSSWDGDVVYNHGNFDGWVFKIDSVGNLQWQNTYGGSDFDYLTGGIEQLYDSSYVFAAETHSSDGDIVNDYQGYDGWLVRIDQAGQIAWQRIMGGSSADRIFGIELVASRRLVCVGTAASNDHDLQNVTSYGNYDTWLFQITVDTLKSTFSGRVYLDVNNNCVYDSAVDKTFTHGQVPGISSNFGYITYNVAQNTYSILGLNQWHYEWQPIVSNMFLPLVDSICPASYSYDVDSVALNITGLDFGLQFNTDCSLLVASIGVDRLRPCFKGNVSVDYCNVSLVDTNNVYVVVDLGYNTIPLSASLPYTLDSRGRLFFFIDTLRSQECGTIIIIDSVKCSTSLIGAQNCLQVYILPTSSCYNSTGWDSSDLHVSAQCYLADTTVHFTIYNYGADMSASSTYRIYTQSGLLQTDTFRINAGDSLEVVIHGYGVLVRIEADNTAGHPFTPTVFAETGDCLNSPGSARSGTSPFPVFDDNTAIDIECLTITGPIDPNDKNATPSGILSEHYVPSGVPLEYKIRFQNTGTDTAYNVEVIDTLSPYLDLATIQYGASSHPYQLLVEGEDTMVLHFMFNNINLVDSNTNEPLSHGFFNFKIEPKASTPQNTVITNFADIYFDFNPPVRTNTPFVTINDTVPQATEQLQVTEVNDTIIIRDTTIITDTVVINDTVYIHDTINGLQFIGVNEYKLYPNPNNGQQFVVEVSGINQHDLQLEVYDPTGKKLRAFALKPKQTLIEPNLQNGFYFYRILSDGQLLRSGKLLVIE